MTISIKAVLGLVVSATLAAACATVPPPLPPVLEYARRDCSATPDLASAISLTPAKETRTYYVSTPVTAQTSCVIRDGGATPYVLYALPSDRADKTLIVGGVLESSRILSPSIRLLDAEGHVTRTFSPADFLYRGPVYSVQFRPRETEAYVIADVDAARVGSRYDAVNVGTNTSVISTGYVASTITLGTETNTSRTFSWEGTVSVTVNDSDTDEKQTP